MNATVLDCGSHGTLEFDVERNLALCKCQPGWSGRTDIISFEGYFCGMPDALERALWVLALFGLLNLTVKHFRAIRTQRVSFLRAQVRALRRGKTLRWFQFPSLQVLVAGLLLSLPGMFVTAGYKLALVPERQIGRATIPTVLFGASVSIGFACNAVSEARCIKLISGGRGSVQMLRIRRYMERRYFLAILLYATSNVLVLLLALALPDQSPHESPMRFLLIVRNLCFVVLLVLLLQTNREVAHMASRLVADLGSAPAECEAMGKTRDVLCFLLDAAEEKRSAAMVVGTLYAVFCLPPLWPFQTVPIALGVVSTAMSKSHFANQFIKHKKIYTTSMLASSEVVSVELHPRNNSLR